MELNAFDTTKPYKQLIRSRLENVNYEIIFFSLISKLIFDVVKNICYIKKNIFSTCVECKTIFKINLFFKKYSQSTFGFRQDTVLLHLHELEFTRQKLEIETLTN